MINFICFLMSYTSLRPQESLKWIKTVDTAGTGRFAKFYEWTFLILDVLHKGNYMSTSSDTSIMSNIFMRNGSPPFVLLRLGTALLNNIIMVKYLLFWDKILNTELRQHTERNLLKNFMEFSFLESIERF